MPDATGHTDIEIIKPQKRNCIVNVKPAHEGPKEIHPALNGLRVRGVLARPQLDGLALHVHAHLQLEVLDERRVDAGPLRLEWRHAVRRDADLAVLDACRGGLGVLSAMLNHVSPPE